MKETTNYNLKLPGLTDYIDVSDFNHNFTIIDKEIIQKLNLSTLTFEKDGSTYVAKLAMVDNRPKLIGVDVGTVITDSGVEYTRPTDATETTLGRVKVSKVAGENAPFTVPTIGHIKERIDHPRVKLGLDSKATGVGAVALGQNSNSSGWRGISIGYGAESTEPSTITVGDRAENTEQSGISIGHVAINRSKRGVAIGAGSLVEINSAESIAIGRLAKTINTYATSIGFQAQTEGVYSISIGTNSASTMESAISLGYNSKATAINTISLGGNSESSGFSSIAVGRTSKALVEGSVAIGWGALANGIHGISIGSSSNARGYKTLALGQGSEALNDYSVALGTGSKTTQGYQGVLGVPTSEKGTNAWIVPGDFSVGGTKNFEIPHPNPAKTETHVLRHGAVETNSQGDNLYRYKIEAKEDGDIITINLPDYFVHLNKNIQVWATGANHFGNAFGTYKPKEEIIEITCEKAGEYNVLVIGTRNDNNLSVQSWNDKGVEKLKDESWTFKGDKDNEEIINPEEITNPDEIFNPDETINPDEGVDS